MVKLRNFFTLFVALFVHFSPTVNEIIGTNRNWGNFTGPQNSHKICVHTKSCFLIESLHNFFSQYYLYFS